jgi:hypothetical protein
MQQKINELKKKVFREMLDLAGRVFIVARYSDNVIIGNRGFTEEERKNGIVLVFNTSMSFSWDDSGIAAVLAFGTSPQKCYIPADDIVAIYSPELNSQFLTANPPEAEKSDQREKTVPELREEEAGSKVVKVDFTRKRTPGKTRSSAVEDSLYES